MVEAASFALKVLGGFQLSRAGVAVAVPTRKLACLLTYLACTAPAPQSREKLANLFWGAQSEVRARHNLRQAILRLRTLLGHDVVVGSGNTVRLRPGVLECDAVRFEALLGEGDTASVAAAAELYGGVLLEDVAGGEAGWNEWLRGERERLSERAVGVIVAHGEDSLASGAAERAMRCGRRAVAIDNFREDAHRLVLRALAAAGRHSEALRHYHDLVSLLKAELGAEPDMETRRLVETLGDGRAPSPHHNRPQTPVAPARAAQAPGASRDAAWIDGAERRQVTVLACRAEPVSPDAPLDPEDLRAFIPALRRTAAEAVAAFGGVVVAGPGTSIQALFGYPEARDRDAAQAVRAAMALIQAFQALGAASGTAVAARVGVAAGLVVIEDGRPTASGPLVIGEAPELAQRLQALASPGEVIVSRETWPLLAGTFELRACETPRGTARVVEAWRVLGETDDAGRSGALSPLAGRQEEFALLLRRWDQVRQGEGRVVLLSGEPGIGKSYLAEHLVAALDGERPAYLQYLCSPHHAIRPLHPYIRQLERSLDAATRDLPADMLDRLAALVTPTSTDVARDVSLLAELLGLPADPRYPARGETPQQKRELVMSAYLEQLAALAAQRPVVVLFEDIHWIDPTSLDLLDRTIARIAQLPVLLIATFRPEHQTAWVGQPHVTLLHLNRLGRHESAAIVGDVSRERPLPPPVVAQIVDRADGVPLFVTELSKHLLESGLLEGQDAVTRPAPLSMPTTLQAALSVRLDGLGPARSLALIGSAIGRQFSRGLLAAITGTGAPDLDAALQHLTASGLVSRRGTPPDDSYAFTHALGRDAAYAMILKDQRRRLHGTIADVLIERFPGQPEGLPEVVAHHLSQAGRTGEAADHWAQAARAARARWANRECADFFDLALRAVDDQPRTPATLSQAIDLRFEMKNALTPLGEFERIIGYLQEAKLLIDQLGDPQKLCQFQVHMCQALGFCGRSSEAIAFGQDAERLARSLGDPRLRIEATIFLATGYFTVMDYPPAERLFRDVLDLLDEAPAGERFALAGSPGIAARAYLTRINALWGEFDRGIRYGEEAVRQAEALEQPYSLGLSLWSLADLHLTRGDLGRAIALLERGLAVSRAGDLPFLIAGHSGSLGYAYALTNRAEEGLALLETAVSAFETMRHQFALSIFDVPLGEAYVLGGRLDRARTYARDALKQARDNGQRSAEAGFLRILADVSARTGHLEQAAVQYREAGALAESLRLRPLAARCRHGLAGVKARMAGQDKTQDDLAAATAMYRDMGMGFWLDQAQALDGV